MTGIEEQRNKKIKRPFIFTPMDRFMPSWCMSYSSFRPDREVKEKDESESSREIRKVLGILSTEVEGAILSQLDGSL